MRREIEMSDDEGHVNEPLDLRSLKPGDRLHILGDDSDHHFTCIEQAEAGPVGTIHYSMEGFMVVQLLGMGPWSLNSYALQFEPAVLKCEYGKLLMMETTTSVGHDFTSICCTSYKLERASDD